MRGRTAGTAVGALPEPIPPMIAVPGELPAGDDWAVEFAWEGLRCLAYALPGRLRLLTAASDRDVTGSFPELVAPVTAAAPRRGVVLDGTVVAIGDTGFPRRSLLQARSATARPSEALLRRTPVGFFVGDLLWLDGRPALDLPYHRRRELLAELGLNAPPVVVSPSFPLDDVGFVVRAAEQHGVEALHARHLDAPYRPGRRSRAWLRVPLGRSRQVVVGGWTPADPLRPDSVGALLLGVPADSADPAGPPHPSRGLRYVGRAGLGSAPEHRELAALLPRLGRHRSPFTAPLPTAAARDGQWAAPQVVGLVEFAGWTPDGRLRRARWRGLVAAPDIDPERWARPPDRAADPSGTAEPESTGTAEPADAAAEPAGAAAAAVPAAEPGPAATAAARPGARSLEQHFVYNSMNTIASLVRTDPNRARELLLGFADLARAADRPESSATTLGDELAAVRAYLQIEQARFGKRLRVELDVDPDLHTVSAPPMAVLAVVRATVQERIEPRPGGGTLSVRAEPTDGGCLVRVADEGVGEPIVIALPARAAR